MISMNEPTKIAAARINPGMTIRVAALELLDANQASPMLARLDADLLAAGYTHNVPCGSVTDASPTRTVASVDDHRANQYGRVTLGSLRVTFTTGEVVKLSTRQKVEVAS